MTQPEETSISEDDWHILNPADDPDATVLVMLAAMGEIKS